MNIIFVMYDDMNVIRTNDSLFYCVLVFMEKKKKKIVKKKKKKFVKRKIRKLESTIDV